MNEEPTVGKLEHFDRFGAAVLAHWKVLDWAALCPLLWQSGFHVPQSFVFRCRLALENFCINGFSGSADSFSYTEQFFPQLAGASAAVTTADGFALSKRIIFTQCFVTNKT